MFFLYTAESRQEEQNSLVVTGQLLEPVDLGCQSEDVIIVLARHFDRIHTTCVLGIRPSDSEEKAGLACMHTHTYTHVAHICKQ